MTKSSYMNENVSDHGTQEARIMLLGEKSLSHAIEDAFLDH